MARPTREFFEQKPRAALLRNLCLAAVMDSEVVLATQGEDTDAFDRLLDINHRLDELGVQPEMHTLDPEDPNIDQKRERLATDPVLAAEWIAGQVRDVFVGSSLFTDAADPAVIAEHDELQGEGGTTSLINLHAAGPKTIKLLRNVEYIGAFASFLDVEAGPSNLAQLGES